MNQKHLTQFRLFEEPPVAAPSDFESLPDIRIENAGGKTAQAGQARLITRRSPLKISGAVDIASTVDGRAAKLLNILKPPYLEVFWLSLQGTLVHFEKNGEIQVLTNADLVTTGLSVFGYFNAIAISRKQREIIRSNTFQTFLAAYTGRYRKESRTQLISHLEPLHEALFKSHDFNTCMKILFSTSSRTIHYDRKVQASDGK